MERQFASVFFFLRKKIKNKKKYIYIYIDEQFRVSIRYFIYRATKRKRVSADLIAIHLSVAPGSMIFRGQRNFQ